MLEKNVYMQQKRVCANDTCDNEFISKNPKHKFCCCQCAIQQRNRDNYAKKYKNINIQKEDQDFVFEMYKKQCNFKFALKDFPSEFNFNLILENGWYKAKNHGDNLGGVSRDHMFSINQAFIAKIDPYYISHPVNCQLLLHSDNSSKHSKCSITKEELMERVNRWNEKYGKYENKIDYLLLENFGLSFK